MKYLSYIIFIVVLISSCSRDEIVDTPTNPETSSDQNLSFKCAKHNLSYRYASMTSKKDSMPCPECDPDASYSFLKAHNLNKWQIECPIDKDWTTFNYNDLNYKNVTEWPTGRLKRPVAWLPSITYDSIKGNTISQLQGLISTEPSNLFVNSFPYFLCDSCFVHTCKAAIQIKTDSINSFHSYIDGIIGMNFTSYPFKTGMPVDRRVRAQAILDSVQNMLPYTTNSHYDAKYSTINKFVGGWDGARQDYIYCKKTGIAQGSYVDYDTYMKGVTDAYISDTVIINIAGGPDYANGGYYYIPTWRSKSSTNTVQSSSRFPAASLKILSHGMPALSLKKKAKRYRSSASDSYQLLSTFQPGNVDLFPASYLPRKYNTYTTSVFNIFHPQKGNSTVYSSRGSAQPTWNFVDLFKTVGGTTRPWPYNITSDYYGELLNDVGVMEIRTVVNWCKARGKKIVLMGSSWGGAMIFDYIRYYGTSDFEQVVIADQNPNIPSNIVSSEFETYIYQSGTQGVSTDMNPNMCVLASDVYRRMEWLQGKNLSNVTFYCATTDTNVGMIPASDIATLKNQGAKVYAFPSPITHGVFQDTRAWYRYVTPALQ